MYIEVAKVPLSLHTDNNFLANTYILIWEVYQM